MLTLLFLMILVILALNVGALVFALVTLAKNPPTIRAEILLPAPNVSKQIAEAPVIAPIPEDVLDYIDQESEEHARVMRRNRARALYGELGNWEAAFRQLQREDNLA